MKITQKAQQWKCVKKGVIVSKEKTHYTLTISTTVWKTTEVMLQNLDKKNM